MMKEQLLTLALALAACVGSASALNTVKVPFESSKAKPRTAANAPARVATENGFKIDFCGEVDNWYALTKTNNTTYKIYTYVDAATATALAGNQLTSLSISFASARATTTKSGTIFVYEDINGEPVTSTDVTIVNNLSTEADYTDYAFDTPYTIKDGVGFYMAYEVTKCTYSSAVTTRNDYPLAVTADVPNEYGASVVVSSSTGAQLLKYTSDEIGLNIFLQGTTVGEKTGVQNVFSVGEISFGDFTLPVVENVNDAYLSLPVKNMGTNAITSVEYTATCGDETKGGVFETNFAGNGNEGVINLPLPTLTEGKGTVDVKVSAVNGIAVNKSATLNYIGLVNGGYDRKFIVEEGTGTWCGWCPRGIVAFEQLEANYPDKFIGIAVHYDDNMATSSYTALISKFFSGFPSCIINRDPIYNTDPSPEELELCYQLWSTQKGAAKVNARVEYIDDKNVTVKTDTEFGFSYTDGKYRLAYVVLEDGIVGSQSNYYAGGSYGQMGGWENYGSTKSWVYKHVARNIFTCWGVTNSVPAEATAGQNNYYEYNVDLTGVSKVGNSSIVVLLVDSTSGVILNAAKVKAADYIAAGQDGISDITTEDTPAVYYNLQGVQMRGSNLPSGIYIKQSGNKSEKVVVK